ncbi:ligand-binding sensor domain-containing diguanylate cyclase [Paucibacter sp. DJ2R-2]|uniref:ligand-binding sensor domain-containing diguanylate cyclase n=1 Tax=Paucibacter sp. DJ2R-2 TaxID=2893558 RepID=UPI0021E3CCBB|nr:ligand-binding sensor domain-containing diguanylate cyclase [Paucibacter sp. DJ2R-2]MCV2419458.1 diguanylate cyclase [Paucibacter sp. DJ4R-1]MCV2437638.1 diguanylate cyclase [Paucibacter sp. DJ2R-2]
MSHAWRAAGLFLLSLAVLLLRPNWIGSAQAAAPPARWAELADATFHNRAQDAGLPNSLTTAIAEDGDGFLWVGTQSGLARWDGHRFRHYKPQQGDPRSLPDHWVTRLHRDRQGRLWIGTSAGGLARYERQSDDFKRFAPGPGGLRSAAIYALAEDGRGGLLIGGAAGLDRLDLANDTIQAQAAVFARPGESQAPAEQIQALLLDRSGGLWVGGTLGLRLRPAGATAFQSVDLPAGKAQAVQVWSLYQDEQAQVWVGSRAHGAFRVPASGQGAERIGGEAQGFAALRQSWVHAIGGGAPGEVWLGCYGQGLVAVDSTSGRLSRIRHDPGLSNSLAGDIIFAIYRDDRGNSWVGSQRGLSRSTTRPGVQTLFGGSHRPVLRGGDVFALLATRDGRIWLGLQGEGVDIIDPAHARTQALRADPDRPEEALPSDHIFGLAQGEDGNVYLATGRGLYQASEDGRQLRRLQLPGRAPSLSSYRLLAQPGRLWLGGRDDGLWLLPLPVKPGQAAEQIPPAALSDGRITVLRQGRDGEVWVGTRNGLNRISADRKITRISADPADPQALGAGLIASLLLDRQQRLWVATLGGGLHLLTHWDGERPRFRRLGTAQGLPSANVDGLLEDAGGQIWASTADGIARIDPERLSVQTLRAAEGVFIRGYWIDAAAVAADGSLLFGGEGGLTVLQPERIQSSVNKQELVLTEGWVGDRAVPLGRFNGAASASTEPLRLAPNTRGLSIEFSALDFVAPERRRYRYQLDGFDKDWIETDASRRLAAYTHLPPGSYRLRLASSDGQGDWTESSLSVPIEIQAAWYQTRGFQLLLGLLLLGGVLALVQMRTAWLKRRQRRLEGQVAERTAQLEQSTEELRLANERLFLLATSDALTGCSNRRYFMEQAQRQLAAARRSGQALCLLMLDLDHFKRVNDQHGHPAGDEVLRQTAELARAQVRSADLLGRLGGEEFALLLPDTDRAGARLLGERLLQAIREREFAYEQHRLHVSASLGLAQLRPGESLDSLYARADLALYAAKAAGRDRISDDMDDVEPDGHAEP